MRLGVPIYTWTATEGPRRGGTAPGLYDSHVPLKALQNIASLTGVALYLLKDFHRYLEEAVLVRKVRDLCPAFSRDGRTLIISGPSIPVPAELQRVGVIFRLDLPGEPELKDMVERSLPRLVALAAASEGFSGAELEQAIVAALHAAFSRKSELSIDLILEELQSTRPLSVLRREEIEGLRAWAAGRTVPAS